MKFIFLNVLEQLLGGASVHEYLYRELCKACRIGVEEVSGNVLLLQLWARTRLHTLAPIPVVHMLIIKKYGVFFENNSV